MKFLRTILRAATVFLGLLFISPKVFPAEKVIKDASVYRGFSDQADQVDVGIMRERIHSVGDLSDYEAFETIDAKGWVLAPGFIDAHTHSDFNALIYPKLKNKIFQGVTTEIVGNCGMSAAPVQGIHRRHVHSVWAREGVQIPQDLEWGSFAQYREAFEKKGMHSNVVGLVGHGNLRMAVMGVTPRKASPSEVELMKDMLAQSMEEGARGISFGLVYLPGIFSEEWELVELCREAARHSGVCTFHMRSEGSGLVEAVKEVLRIGKKAQASIQISHLKVGGNTHPFASMVSKAS